MLPTVFAEVITPSAAAVFTTILTQGPVSRVDIARRTGLSSAAVTKAARPFITAGYLGELGAAGRVPGGAGRPVNPLVIRPEREFFVGVKVSDSGYRCRHGRTTATVSSDSRPKRLYGREDHVVSAIAHQLVSNTGPDTSDIVAYLRATGVSIICTATSCVLEPGSEPSPGVAGRPSTRRRSASPRGPRAQRVGIFVGVNVSEIDRAHSPTTIHAGR